MLPSPQFTHAVGRINQIKDMYVPIWWEGSGDRVQKGSEHILFADRRKHSRVSTFRVQEE